MKKFIKKKPFPWVSLEKILFQDRFEELVRDFPSLDLFQYHQTDPHPGHQRPHNRYYACFGSKQGFSMYKFDSSGKGAIHLRDLKESWQQFLYDIKDNQVYHDFIHRMLGTKDYNIQVVWHVGITGNEVSPHVDIERKLGTHLFYFNTSDDWEPDWGGQFLVLEGCKKEIVNPDYEDFENIVEVPILDNRSLIFKNKPGAWHGVRPLKCPEGKYRRLMNIIFC